MAYSTLKRKTPLRAKSALKAKSSLKSYSTLRGTSTLKTNKSLRDSYAEKVRFGEKAAPKKKSSSYKPKYEYASIFTKDLDTCVITGSRKPEFDIHLHHIFGASNKANSEKYHFMLPLRADWHDMADYGIHFNKELDLKYKRKCQEYWLSHYGTKEEFIETFGQWW